MSGSAAGPAFRWDLVSDLRAIWQFEFMRNAFEAGTIIALVAGLIGYFVVLRRSSFATHALGHTGFSGAAAAVLVGVQPVYGLLVFTIGTASGMALLGKRASSRDVEIGTVLAFALGLGLLFLSLYQGYATEAYSILFGEVLGISTSMVVFTFYASLVVLAVVALIYRPLLFSSLDEDVAEAKGLPMVALNLAFMVLLAITISIAVQIIGVLLIFALMVTPAAIAVQLTKRVLSAVVVSILIAVTATWAGLFIGWYEPYPVSFFIVGIVFGEYVAIRGMGILRESAFLQAVDVPEREGVRSLRNASLVAILSQLLLLGGAVSLAATLWAHPGAAWNAGRIVGLAPVAVVLLGS
jgi:zinc/manganese transport system permease protein